MRIFDDIIIIFADIYTHNMEFKKILGFKFAANLTLGIILFGGIIFTLGFGISLLIARQEVS